MPNFPGVKWETAEPAAVGLDAEKLRAAQEWVDAQAEARPPNQRQYRVVIVRDGRLVAEWNHGVERSEPLPLASAAKSIFSSILGIVIEQGTIGSADDRVVDYYPEMMDVPNGTGPKPGRHAFEKDRAITFRQLISNTSGYMKPDEEPGTVFHYQTYGMNILTHAMAKAHGLYDPHDVPDSPGLKPLIDKLLRIPIGASWTYEFKNFDLHSDARLNIFGYYDGVKATALDMARLGWLWRHRGRWGEQQLIPEAWLREATGVAPAIRKHCPPEQWCYGYGFWTNAEGRMWPHLPRDSFAAAGAQSKHIWVCPSLDLVVTQSPGVFVDQAENDEGLLGRILQAVR